ncbi:hypothetical protein CBE01nite_24530 [Clostridium beijerinckii]|uniref:Uncharacterized protein n=1 Tax=Clostridium beijerinckii TaxID=1520 RepID=A0AB74V9A5_CLOBE|nr:hypothetical protein [Clostridium beijerinckii]NRZ27139.1 hypothetical protein [Clostridium beijerinckii]NYB97065.1 hypothetical protein [Clostridium beijerinckii]QUN33008.1 hypothetical protein KEC93_13445 [Clostridium beijerinckii]SQB21170.1 Uncharacterised protein [Clostridium beijerinckii]GEP64685.1 hypothetical protein CBE01nite_24530 [Clostridium beijerinckii]
MNKLNISKTKNPENKELYIRENSEYAEYVLSRKESSEGENDDSSEIKKVTPLRLSLAGVLVAIFIFLGMYLLGSFN